MSDVGGEGIKGTESTGGEVNTGANVGGGAGLIFKDKTGVFINFKTLLAGLGITINNLGDEVEIVASGGSFSTQEDELTADFTTTSTLFIDITALSITLANLTNGKYFAGTNFIHFNSGGGNVNRFRWNHNTVARDQSNEVMTNTTGKHMNVCDVGNADGSILKIQVATTAGTLTLNFTSSTNTSKIFVLEAGQ